MKVFVGHYISKHGDDAFDIYVSRTEAEAAAPKNMTDASGESYGVFEAELPGILVPLEDAKHIHDAAQSYVDDLDTGLEDGTYEDDPGSAKIGAALERLSAAIEESRP